MWRLASRSALLDIAILTLLDLALTLPFGARMLWAWDSVLYARAIDDFQLGATPLEQRPHAPGYFLYVLAARAATAILGDPNAGLVAISMVSGVLVVPVAYLAGRAIGGRVAGVAAAIVSMANPVLWHASEIAYPYANLAFLAGALGVAFWYARGRGDRAIVAASALFGIALGVRQDLIAYLAPLWLYTLVARGWRGIALGTLSLASTSLLWLVPTAIAAGGLDRYIALVVSQAAGSSELSGGLLTKLGRNLSLSALGLRWQLLWLWPIAAAGAWLLYRRDARAAAFVALWMLPATIVLLFFHTGEAAYTLVLAVPLAVIVGNAFSRVVALPKRTVAIAGSVAMAALVVMLGATFALGAGRFSASAIRRHDEILQTQIAVIRARFNPATAVILARANYLHAVAYLPEFRAVYVPSRDEGGHARQILPALRGRTVAIFFDDSHPMLRRLATLIRLRSDVDLYVMRLDARSLAAFEAADDDLEED